MVICMYYNLLSDLTPKGQLDFSGRWSEKEEEAIWLVFREKIEQGKAISQRASKKAKLANPQLAELARSSNQIAGKVWNIIYKEKRKKMRQLFK